MQAKDMIEVSPGKGAGTLRPRASEGFVESDQVRGIVARAAAYLDAGYPVHLSGPAGTGKTTLAFHVASQRGRPVSLIHGNDSFGGSDLVGKDSGYKKTSTIDNYIHSVLKTEEKVDVNWTDNRLTKACENGHTLIYDEFNRTRAEANNILLSILEEGILSLPKAGGGYLRVHPEFRVVFTSNPEEYAGVHRAQDALLDRLITIQADHYDLETEIEIVARRGLVPVEHAAVFVELARVLRAASVARGGAGHRPTIRAAIAAGRVSRSAEIPVEPGCEMLYDMLFDVFGSDAGDSGLGVEARAAFDRIVDEVFDAVGLTGPVSAAADSPGADVPAAGSSAGDASGAEPGDAEADGAARGVGGVQKKTRKSTRRRKAA